MSILQTTELKKYYGAEPNITRALDGVTLSIEKGEFVAIVGTSGSGKSTLLNMIGGLDVPTSGQVVVDGKELSKLKDEELTVFRRRKIGFIFQNYNLVPVLNVFENIVLPVELDGNKVDKKFMKEVVQMLGLEDKLNNMPNNLSGGQQQRVAIARALVSKPAIALVGLINFINLVMTNIITRRHEFATMQSIGMTNRQLRKMMISESFSYVLLAGIVGTLAAAVLGITLVRSFVEISPSSIMMTFQMTLLPALIMLILFLALAFIVPVVALRLFNNRSVVERLRVNE